MNLPNITLSKKSPLMVTITISTIILTGCDSSSQSPSIEETKTAAQVATSQGIDLSMFKEGAFVETPKIVDCTTSEGTKTTCYQLVTSGAPAGREPGPLNEIALKACDTKYRSQSANIMVDIKIFM